MLTRSCPYCYSYLGVRVFSRHLSSLTTHSTMPESRLISRDKAKQRSDWAIQSAWAPPRARACAHAQNCNQAHRWDARACWSCMKCPFIWEQKKQNKLNYFWTKVLWWANCPRLAGKTLLVWGSENACMLWHRKKPTGAHSVETVHILDGCLGITVVFIHPSLYHTNEFGD